MTGADPGANSGITFGVASSAPEQLIPVASLSVTVTFDRYDVPVFDTTNDTDNGEPAETDTPGAVFASSPLIDFTMLTPAVAGAYACAGSLSWTLRMGCPSTPKTGVPSATTGVPVAVTVSIGGVNAPRHARTLEDALNRAQDALDLTRRRRRGGFAAWQPNAARDAQRRDNIRITDEIVTALNDRRMTIAFEPVVDATTRIPAFHECLVRIRQGEGLIAASDIVPVAEKLGLIRLVDHRVLQLVLDELSASPAAQLSLNISPDTTGDPD